MNWMIYKSLVNPKSEGTLETARENMISNLMMRYQEEKKKIEKDYETAKTIREYMQMPLESKEHKLAETALRGIKVE